ncbi:MAG: methyltransferase [Proteobacteria bacterium]|nr:methyltransferase [Pseudomonadota bacterium]
MAENIHEQAQALRDVASGYALSKALYAVADARVADFMDDAPVQVSRLAAQTGSNEDALYRIMRTLACLGIFFEHDGQAFSHTPVSRLLRADHAHSQLDGVLFRGLELYEAYIELPHTLATGTPSFERRFGMSMFEYLNANSDMQARFQACMESDTRAQQVGILEAYDFSPFASIVDVGGGNGTLIAAILSAQPNANGILFDRKSVLDQVRESPGGAIPRCQLLHGDFFDAVPTGGDLYILKYVIHDWRDGEALTILKNCRRAMNGGAKLLVIDAIFGPPNVHNTALTLDLSMLAAVGGVERRQSEFKALFHQAGLALKQVIATKSPLSILEVIPG